MNDVIWYDVFVFDFLAEHARKKQALLKPCAVELLPFFHLCAQVRVPKAEVVDCIQKLCNNFMTWTDMQKKYPEHKADAAEKIGRSKSPNKSPRSPK